MCVQKKSVRICQKLRDELTQQGDNDRTYENCKKHKTTTKNELYKNTAVVRISKLCYKYNNSQNIYLFHINLTSIYQH